MKQFTVHTRSSCRRAFLFLFALGCTNRTSHQQVFQLKPSRGSNATEQVASPKQGATQMKPAPAYPPGRWRFAHAEELDRVVLWVSHILIRHSAVEPGIVSFKLPVWTPAPAAPQRSRAAAHDLALRLRDELERAPARFSELAASVSEDVATRERGGSLGGVSAYQLSSWPQVLDALAAIRPGEISRVIESPYGFHIFLRRVAPSGQTVSGARIVIGYDEAPWLHRYLARRAVPQRSRREALTLAHSVYEQVRAGVPFVDLVEKYSDHQDALRKGDFGAWSTREVTPFPTEVEVLQQLEVGGVAPPLDSFFGVEIIQRTADRARPLYAMSTVEQRFDVFATEQEPASRESVRSHMQSMLQTVMEHPEQLQELQRKYCCTDLAPWQEGQGAPDAETALAQLRTGEIAKTLVEEHSAYAIVQRLPAHSVTQIPVALELPAPEQPDIRYLARGARVNYQLPAVAREALESLTVDPATAETLLKIHEAASKTDEQFEDGRVARFDEFLASIRALLTAEDYSRYEAILEGHFAALLLASPSPFGMATSAPNTDLASSP